MAVLRRLGGRRCAVDSEPRAAVAEATAHNIPLAAASRETPASAPTESLDTQADGPTPRVRPS